MPRIEVRTSIRKHEHHRRIQAAIVGVFADGGLSAEHVSTEFQPVEPTLMYAGRESLDEVLGKRDFALLRVYISTRRGQDFRDQLVAAIVRVFDGLGVDPANLAIDFVPREAVDSYIGPVLMGATRIPRVAARPAPPQVADVDNRVTARPAPPQVTDVEERVPASDAVGSVEVSVRTLLARFWGPHLLSVPADRALLALVPDPVAWDSLAKAELATNLETWLGLPYNSLDVGTEHVKQMFADTVTLDGLIDSLAALRGAAA